VKGDDVEGNAARLGEMEREYQIRWKKPNLLKRKNT
jgi:hypothetical protein